MNNNLDFSLSPCIFCQGLALRCSLLYGVEQLAKRTVPCDDYHPIGTLKTKKEKQI